MCIKMVLYVQSSSFNLKPKKGLFEHKGLQFEASLKGVSQSVGQNFTETLKLQMDSEVLKRVH